MAVPRSAARTRPTSDARLLIDVATGIVGESVGVAVSLVRTGSRLPGLRSRILWQPAFVPYRYQPASLLAAAARRGEEHQVRAIQHLERLLDTWTPLIAEALVTRLDLDAIASRIDVEAVIGRIDLVGLVDEVLAEIDLSSLIRDSTGSMASETVRNARMAGISADEAISRALERHVFRRRRSVDSMADPS